MIIKLKDGTSITVKQENGIYNTRPLEYQFELDYYVENPPVIAGTFVPDEVNWFVIADIFENHICIRQVKEIILEKGETIEPIVYEDEVVY